MGGKSSSSSDSSQRKRGAKQKAKKSRSSSSSSSSRRKSGKRKRPTDGKRSRSRSGSRRRRRRSVSKQKDRKPQPGAPMQMPLGYGGMHQQHQQMMMSGLWGNAPPPWAMQPPKDSVANRQKKEKKDKKDKKKEKEEKEREEKERKEAESAYTAQIAALEDKVRSEVASRKEVEERLKASDIENEKLRAELAEARKAQEQQASRDRQQLKHYSKELNAKNSEIRIFQEKAAAHASELKAKDLELRNELEKNRNALTQIAHLTTVREGLLVSVRSLKDRNRQLKVSVKKNETSGAVTTSNPVSVTKASVASATREDANAAVTQGRKNPGTDKSGDLESELIRKPRVAKIGARSLIRREQPEHPLEEPRHREATAGPSGLRKRADGSSGEKRSISFAAEGSLATCFDISSFAAYKKKLWVLKAGSTLECNACSVRVPLAQGNLNLDPSRGQFMQERFLCEACCENGTSPVGKPATKLLLADESQGRSGVLNSASEQDASTVAHEDVKADHLLESQNGISSLAASSPPPEEEDSAKAPVDAKAESVPEAQNGSSPAADITSTEEKKL